jgi:peptidyl-tRNA hydrolase ICT1
MSLLRPLTTLRPASLLLRPAATRTFADWRHEVASKWGSQEEIEAAREWVETFKVDDIPKKHTTVAFSASSGPGGQNVNKYKLFPHTLSPSLTHLTK